MANNKHAVVRIDKLGGTLDGAQLESAIFYKESDAAEIDNAQLVVLGEKLGREVYKATAPTATSTVADLYLTAGVELFYDQTVAHYLPEWVNEAGKPVRVYAPRHLTALLQRASMSVLLPMTPRSRFRKLLMTRPLAALTSLRLLVLAMVAIPTT